MLGLHTFPGRPGSTRCREEHTGRVGPINPPQEEANETNHGSNFFFFFARAPPVTGCSRSQLLLGGLLFM